MRPACSASDGATVVACRKVLTERAALRLASNEREPG